jgi:hypothetical protein
MEQIQTQNKHKELNMQLSQRKRTFKFFIITLRQKIKALSMLALLKV